MKIIVIGASGTIGRAVSEELSQRHEVIRVGRTRGDYQVDITSQESVEALFAQTGEVDAIVSTTGNLHFGPLSTMTDSQFNLGLQDKLLGQIRLALVGQHFLRDGGSITLSAVLSRRNPLLRGSMPRRSTPVWKALSAPPPANCRAGSASISSAPPCSASRWRPTATFSRASPSVPAAAVAQAYRRSIEGVQTGRIYPVGY